MLLLSDKWRVWSAKEYDFIIVGGGAAGCLLANRLSAVPEWSVLLIEAGGEESILQDIPLLASQLQLTPANWFYKTEKSNTACLGLKGERCNWPRGKVLGGSTVLNYMVFIRGNPRDYDLWAALGNLGWSYEEVLHYFLKFERMLIPELVNDTFYHSTEGDLPISRAPYRTVAARAFLSAAQELGKNIVDYNGQDQVGYSFVQSTVKDGFRVSSNTAFLKPIRLRNNLDVLIRCQVTKVLIDPVSRTAYGVEYQSLLSYSTSNVLARKEVILSAGAINSPQLLMLSGIGPREHLHELGIPVLQDSNVGYNLQDHIALGNLFFTVNDSITTRVDNLIEDTLSIAQLFTLNDGKFSITGGVEALGFEDINGDGVPDMELIFTSLTLASFPGSWVTWGGNLDIYFDSYTKFPFLDVFAIFPILMHPRSIGRLKLRSKDPFAKPLIFHNYLTHYEDVYFMIEGIKRAIRLSETEAFRKYGAQVYRRPIIPCRHLPFGSDAYWECCIRHMTFTFYHPSGTCKMGPYYDPNAVVDPALRVYGVRNLRVIDASVMPTIPTAHIAAPTFLIAEKGADMVRRYWGR
ncbi:hypothetical protein L9F63_006645 [Diploptera punctata]|uniref:Glucose-methanol-choline oxidoreductase N-terminal domain-containing protein n=1 Tax=Diploptera punctata TaxID=6984 RepID=A0AAD8E4L3_DIPPU|nr:hypothetical protein L9F63_006645 [Diploptera punctata]